MAFEKAAIRSKILKTMLNRKKDEHKCKSWLLFAAIGVLANGLLSDFHLLNFFSYCVLLFTGGPPASSSFPAVTSGSPNAVPVVPLSPGPAAGRAGLSVPLGICGRVLLLAQSQLARKNHVMSFIFKVVFSSRVLTKISFWPKIQKGEVVALSKDSWPKNFPVIPMILFIRK